jgi:hypothetical protein
LPLDRPGGIHSWKKEGLNVMAANLETSPIGDKLTDVESKRYRKLKQQIGSWWKDRLAVGAALREIRDQKLYRQEYSTFEDFCIAEYEIKHSQAYRLIEAADVKESLKTSPIGDKLRNEQQARALALVPLEKRAEVLEEASKDGPATARKITEAAATVKPEKPQQQLDKTGYPIPESILDDWQHAESYSALLREVSNIKKTVSDALEGSDIAFREISNTTIALIQNVYGQLKCIIPYAVCTSCAGHNRAKCTLCKRRGFISKFAWEQYVPAEIKKMRTRT